MCIDLWPGASAETHGDGVVLQRDARVRIWGCASNGEIVAIRFLDSTYPTTAEIALKLGMHNPLEWVDQVV
jgi:hypothetical protein